MFRFSQLVRQRNSIRRIFPTPKTKERDLSALNKTTNNCYDAVVNKRLKIPVTIRLKPSMSDSQLVILDHALAKLQHECCNGTVPRTFDVPLATEILTDWSCEEIGEISQQLAFMLEVAETSDKKKQQLKIGFQWTKLLKRGLEKLKEL